MKQVFVDVDVTIDSSVSLDKNQAHHLFHVTRTTPKETIRIVANNGVFLGRVESEPDLYIQEKVETKEQGPHIILCAALIKFDKFEWMLQKATELGAHTIVPFVSKNIVIRLDAQKEKKKMDRWNKIVMEASKQCNRDYLPTILSIQSLKELENQKAECNLVAYEKEGDPSKHMMHFLSKQPQSVCICIGPEGGFEEEEIAFLDEIGFSSCSLGPRILRAETAACYALSAIECSSHLEV